jgi:glycine cleavage system H lipoate-binding protein
MTVLLILATFIVFLTIDFFYARKRALQPVNVAAREPVMAPRLRPAVVAGFELPENLRYHPGHTWALSESPNLARVGLDDFAVRLIGKIERITLPQRDRWVRQGQTLLTVYRDGGKAEIVSPMEGIITNVNEAVLRDPNLALRDPYGEGWLATVQSPDAKTNFRNLLGGAVARKWLEEAAQRLLSRIPVLAGEPAVAMAQDGGLAVRDLIEHLPEQEWTKLTREFFLS